MNINKRIGLRIKTLRKRRKWSQQDLAEKIERSVDAVSHLERGVSLPGYETLVNLSREFEVPVEEFFDLDREGKTNSKRANLMTLMMDIARSLVDDDLNLAVKQLEALAGARGGRE